MMIFDDDVFSRKNIDVDNNYKLDNLLLNPKLSAISVHPYTNNIINYLYIDLKNHIFQKITYDNLHELSSTIFNNIPIFFIKNIRITINSSYHDSYNTLTVSIQIDKIEEKNFFYLSLLNNIDQISSQVISVNLEILPFINQHRGHAINNQINTNDDSIYSFDLEKKKNWFTYMNFMFLVYQII